MARSLLLAFCLTACAHLPPAGEAAAPPASQQVDPVEVARRACQDPDAARCHELAAGLAKKRGPRDALVQRLLRRACAGGSDEACLELVAKNRVQKKADLVVAALADMAQRNKKTGTTGEPLRIVMHRCGEGDGAACSEAALRHEDGKGVAKDATRGHRFHRLACALGYWFSCNNLTLIYEDALGEKISRRMFKRMCDGGSAYGCYWIAARLMTGLGGLPKRPKQGKALMRKACHGGHGPACHGMALRQTDEGKRRALLQRGCKGGCPDSCQELKQGAKARAELTAGRIACISDRAAGCHAAALSLRRLGGARRLERAAAYLTKACQLKHGPACTELGRAHETGSGVKQDKARAAALHGKGCDLGHAGGCSGLAAALDMGEGVKKDTPRAMKLYARACKAGHLGSCQSLGELHLDPDEKGRRPAHGARLLLGASDFRPRLANKVKGGSVVSGPRHPRAVRASSC